MGVDDVRAAFAAAEDIGGDFRADQDDPESAYNGDPGGADYFDPLGSRDPAPYGEDPVDAAIEGATFPLNDFGNGQRLVHYYGENILYVPRLGWYRWGEKRWQADEDELALRRDAQKIAKHILAEVAQIAVEPWQKDALDLWLQTKDEYKKLAAIKDKSDHQRERWAELQDISSKGHSVSEMMAKAKAAHRAHAKNTGNTSKISNMLLEAKTAVATTVGALNANPLMVNCETGVLHFTCDGGEKMDEWRVTLLPHQRGQLITKMAVAGCDPTVRFNGARDCPLWMGFLERVLPDPAERGYLQRWFGYSLTGLTVEHKMAFFYGGGRNGKSTAVDTIARILDDYGTTIPIETLTGTEQRKGSDATPDLVRLPGARFVRASEPEQGQRMKEALVKALTGGEAIMIRRMQQEFIEVEPEFKLTVSGNHKPEVRGADDGIWSRIDLVPFLVQIPETERDKQLVDKLWAERDGILAWMVDGCLDYLENGLQQPQSILDATEEYRKDSDPMRVFLTTSCKITGNPEHFVKGRNLTDGFNAWMLEQGEAAWGKRTAANAIKARAGVMKSDDGHVFTPGKRSDTGYLGIQISTEAMALVDKYQLELEAAGRRRG